MSKRILVPLASLLILGLAAAGCGSSDDDTDTTAAATISKAEFLKQGNAICTAGNGEINSEFEKFAKENDIGENKEPTQAQLEEAAEQFLLPSISAQIEQIRALGTPETDAESIETFLDNAEAEVEEIEADLSLFQEDSFEEVNAEATAIGLTACGE